jgi:hypothetical protein
VDPIVELLDRQVEFLLGQEEDADFLVQVEPFLRALRSEPRLALHLEDLRSEVLDSIRVMEEIDAELTPELVALRRELVELAPALDDSDAVRAGGQAPDLSFEHTLAFFDEYLAAPAPQVKTDGSGGHAGTLIGILQSKGMSYDKAHEKETAGETESEADARDALRDWRHRLGNLDARHNHGVRWLRLRMRTSAGLALLKLEQVPAELNPEPRKVTSQEDFRAMAEATLKWVMSTGRVLYQAAAGERLDDVGKSTLVEQTRELRKGATRLHEELRHRVGTTRSRLALVERFKARCEWHDRARLEVVADSGPGKAEDRLTAEFARYLFDQGLSPLTKPPTGGLEPDLLDPHASFYVEAKQYKRSARSELVRSVGQVLDTVGRLQGSAFAVEEAFVVVFRRGGPRYVLPPLLEAESYRIHLVLVDIAPPQESGARQQQRPVVLKAQEFFAAAEEAEARDAAPTA